ncbi:hypothetical protein ACH4PU_34155 [Streptomyces sp. NPDC021100]|uniref:hypothetical protein n=1 Tax=Streptomyces sp. NPDC021100 TaxID=3365114 RepID=UPI0037B47785
MPHEDTPYAEVPPRILAGRDALAEAMAAEAVGVDARAGSPANIVAVGLTRDPFPDGQWAVSVHVVNAATTADLRALLAPLVGEATAQELPLVVHVTGMVRQQRASAQRVALPDRTKKRRPYCAGISTGHIRVGGSGTLGCLAVRQTTGETVVLSNNHVIALRTRISPTDQPGKDDPKIGDQILQPGPGDGGVKADNSVAFLESWVPLVEASQPEGTWALVDAAVARCAVLAPKSRLVLDDQDSLIPFHGRHRSATVGLEVRKYGRTTGLTRGRVTEIGVKVRLHPPDGSAGFVAGMREQITVAENKGPKEFISLGGDSGSLWIADTGDNLDGWPVALLCGGNDEKGPAGKCFASRIETVKRMLDIQLLTEYDPPA